MKKAGLKLLITEAPRRLTERGCKWQMGVAKSRLLDELRPGQLGKNIQRPVHEKMSSLSIARILGQKREDCIQCFNCHVVTCCI